MNLNLFLDYVWLHFKEQMSFLLTYQVEKLNFKLYTYENPALSAGFFFFHTIVGDFELKIRTTPFY